MTLNERIKPVVDEQIEFEKNQQHKQTLDFSDKRKLDAEMTRKLFSNENSSTGVKFPFGIFIKQIKTVVTEKNDVKYRSFDTTT